MRFPFLINGQLSLNSPNLVLYTSWGQVPKCSHVECGEMLTEILAWWVEIGIFLKQVNYGGTLVQDSN